MQTLAKIGLTLGTAALGASLAAAPQLPELTPAEPSPQRSLSDEVPASTFRVPIHTAPEDGGMAYGIWASGPDYKVSFHDGMAFHPVLGKDAPHNLPLRWRTTSVTVGGHELADQPLATAHTDWRFEYRFAEFTEAYDVRPEGVEQTFVLHQAPAAGGDLVIRGTFETELSSDRAEGVGDLVFQDDAGRPVVRYGRAMAIDALGHERDMPTHFDGDTVELRLSADFLADAAYPLVVDPLLSNAFVAPGGGQPLDVKIARSNREGELAVAMTRRVSANDDDAYVFLMKDNWAFATPIFADITSSWSNNSIDLGYVYAGKRWLVAFNRTLTGMYPLRAHFHDGGDFNLTTTYTALTSSDYATNIAVGGCSFPAGLEALVVYREDQTVNDLDSVVRGMIVDVGVRLKVTDFDLSIRGPDNDAEFPQVQERRESSTVPWYVTFQVYNNSVPNDDWDIRLCRVFADGQFEGPHLIGNTWPSVTNFVPHVEGGSDYCMVAFMEEPTTTRYVGVVGAEVWTQRIDWPAQGSPIARAPARVLRNTSRVALQGIGHDNLTRSHWTLTMKDYGDDSVRIDRVGHDGLSTETQKLPGAWSADVTFDTQARQYSIAFGNLTMALGTKLAYPAGAGTSKYGSGCGPASIGPSEGSSHANLPWSGTDNFGIELEDAPNGASAVLMLGAQGSFDLTLIGLPGCALNLDPARSIVALPVPLTGTRADVPLPIPSTLKGDAHLQWVYTNPAAPGGLQATRGLKVSIR